ncbi:MAG: HlyD family secretion protein [Pseudomonadales bacterium]|nr:HlyD family secretion protein [Pseudomonadales bacterium]
MSEENQADSNTEQTAEASVKKGTAGVLLVIAISMIWYLMSDRFTPYTQQARIQGYVVGVAPKVAGIVTEVWVKNNHEVEAGQALFQIDPEPYEIALRRAESDFQKIESDIQASDASIESARANLRAAQANETKARQDSVRQERLYKQDAGTISVRRLEVARATLEQAKAKVAGRQSDVQRAIEQKGGEGDHNAKLKTALTTVEQAKLDLNNTKVVASSRGMVTDLQTDIGQYAGTGSPVMTLISMNDVWINAEFTENNLGHMRPGTPVGIVLDVLPGEVLSGKVRSIGLGVSTGQAPSAGSLPSIDNNRDWLRQSQRYPVIIEFDKGQHEALDGFIRIGGQAEVMAYTEGHGVLKLLGKLYLRVMSWFSYAY